MMRWIIGSSMQLRFVVVILAAVLIIYGSSQLRSMPVDVFPEFDPPLVEVQTEALGLSSSEVESLITTPMEQDLLNGVAWMSRIYSESVTGLSSILLVFEPGTDPIRARQMVQERLTQAHALPNVSKPPVMLQPSSTTSRVLIVGLSSEDHSLIEMGVLARWNIKPRLMGVPGVANVSIWGQRERQLQVQVDPQQLQAKGVTLSEVIETTGEALWVSPLSYLESSSPGTAGWIDSPNQRLGIRHVLPIVTPEDLAKISVVNHKDMVLGDVATLVEDHQPLIGDAIVNNGPGLMLVIEKFPGASTLEVTKAVEDALATLAPGLTGITIDSTIFRAANYIEASSRNLSLALLIGAVLVALVLGGFFFAWRSTLISVLAIGLTLISAALVLYLRGATFNIMVLSGMMIAVAIIIDDAVIDVENIGRRLRQARKANSGVPAMETIIAATSEVRSPIVFATLILLLVATPLFFMQGLSGVFLNPLVVSYVLALLVSFIVALFVTPALSMLLMADAPLARRESPLVERMQRSYSKTLARAIRTSRPAYLAIVGLMLVGFIVLPFLGRSMLPTLKQTDLLIQWETPPGTSPAEMNRIAMDVGAKIRAIPGVRNIATQVGRAETGDQVVGINSGQIWISLDPAADYQATTAALQAATVGYPAVFRTAQNYLPKRIGEVLTKPDHDIVVRVYGHDFDVLQAKANDVATMLGSVSGIVDARADALAMEPQVEIKVDLAKAERVGIKPGDVRRESAALLSGLQVGSLFEDQKVFDVVVWGKPEIRDSLDDLRNFLLNTPSGGHVRLNEVADVSTVPAPIMIKRDAVSRYIDVGATVNGRNLNSVVTDIEARLRTIEFPMEFHAEVLGASTARLAAQQRMLIVIAIVMVGIFLLLQAAFSSWRMATAAFVSIPTALTGGVLAALIAGGMLSLGSLFGFFALLGLAIRNSVLLISHYDYLQYEENVPFGPELILQGARERLGPMAMTALATGLALLPFVIFGAIPGLEIIHPMAVVILGGLVTTTVLSLFVMPALYLRFGSSRDVVAARTHFEAVGAAAD